jgi:hypothetical protein
VRCCALTASPVDEANLLIVPAKAKWKPTFKGTASAKIKYTYRPL